VLNCNSNLPIASGVEADIFSIASYKVAIEILNSKGVFNAKKFTLGTKYFHKIKSYPHGIKL
jgi:hypothetical protein